MGRIVALLVEDWIVVEQELLIMSSETEAV